MLDIINGGVPWVQFDNAHFHQAKKPIKVIDPQPHTFATFAFLNSQLMHGIRDFGQSALVIERDAVGVANQLERASAKVDERLPRYLRPISDQILFRGHDGLGQQLQNVFGRDAETFIGRRPLAA